jgi:pSer/pThr/pTyr-binding forkhead associated (FHA) protein
LVRRVVATLGSDSDNDVVLRGDGVASKHAELRLSGGVWTLRTLGPEGITVVDGEAVRGEAVLAPGSLLRLGGVSLIFDPEDRWQDSPLEPGPPTGTAPHLPVHRRPFWPTTLFIAAVLGVLAALYLLFRTV